MKYCLALDLKDEATIIAEYEKWHQEVWPEIKTSITDSGITQNGNLSYGKQIIHDYRNI